MINNPAGLVATSKNNLVNNVLVSTFSAVLISKCAQSVFAQDMVASPAIAQRPWAEYH